MKRVTLIATNQTNNLQEQHTKQTFCTFYISIYLSIHLSIFLNIDTSVLYICVRVRGASRGGWGARWAMCEVRGAMWAMCNYLTVLQPSYASQVVWCGNGVAPRVQSQVVWCNSAAAQLHVTGSLMLIVVFVVCEIQAVIMSLWSLYCGWILWACSASGYGKSCKGPSCQSSTSCRGSRKFFLSFCTAIVWLLSADFHY